METPDVNQNTLLNKRQAELIEYYYPALSEKRRAIRKAWNRINKESKTHINWEDYLLYRAIKEHIAQNIELPF